MSQTLFPQSLSLAPILTANLMRSAVIASDRLSSSPIKLICGSVDVQHLCLIERKDVFKMLMHVGKYACYNKIRILLFSVLD